MREQQASIPEQESIHCIYCGSTTMWPVAQMWPSTCLHCGRGPGAYTVSQPEQIPGEQAYPHCGHPDWQDHLDQGCPR